MTSGFGICTLCTLRNSSYTFYPNDLNFRQNNLHTINMYSCVICELFLMFRHETIKCFHGKAQENRRTTSSILWWCWAQLMFDRWTVLGYQGLFKAARSFRLYSGFGGFAPPYLCSRKCSPLILTCVCVCFKFLSRRTTQRMCCLCPCEMEHPPFRVSTPAQGHKDGNAADRAHAGRYRTPDCDRPVINRWINNVVCCLMLLGFQTPVRAATWTPACRVCWHWLTLFRTSNTWSTSGVQFPRLKWSGVQHTDTFCDAAFWSTRCWASIGSKHRHLGHDSDCCANH